MIVKRPGPDAIKPEDLACARVDSLTMQHWSSADHPLGGLVQKPQVVCHAAVTYPCLVRTVDQSAVKVSKFFSRNSLDKSVSAFAEFLLSDKEWAPAFKDPCDRLLACRVYKAVQKGEFIRIRQLPLPKNLEQLPPLYSLGFNRGERLIHTAYSPSRDAFIPTGFSFAETALGDYIAEYTLADKRYVSGRDKPTTEFWEWARRENRRLYKHAKSCVLSEADFIEVRFLATADTAVRPEVLAVLERNGTPLDGALVRRSDLRLIRGEAAVVRVAPDPVTVSHMAAKGGKTGCRVDPFFYGAGDPFLFSEHHPHLRLK